MDLDRGPVNAAGLVEFSADLCIIRPADRARGNGIVLFEVVNRGKKGMLGMFNRARASEDPISARELGDGLLLREGYTLVWVGWQHDVPRSAGLMRVYPPVARSVSGVVRSEYMAPAGTTVVPLGDAGHVPYAVSGIESVSISVRRDLHGPRKTLDPADWKLEDGRIVLNAPAATSGIYEVVYRATDPAVAGVGLAAIRDVVSWLKRDHRHAIGVGVRAVHADPGSARADSKQGSSM